MTYFRTGDGVTVWVTGNQPFHFFTILNYPYSLGKSGEGLRGLFCDGVVVVKLDIQTRSLREAVDLGDLLLNSGFEVISEELRKFKNDMDRKVKSHERRFLFSGAWPEYSLLEVKLKKSEVDKFLKFIKNLKGWKTVYASDSVAVIR